MGGGDRVAAEDVAGRRVEEPEHGRIGGGRGSTRRLRIRPGDRDEAGAVPAPGARPRPSGREAVGVRGAQNELRLPDTGSDGVEVGAVVPLHDELPGRSGPSEDDPAGGPPAARDRERRDHRLAPRAGEGAAEHLRHRVGDVGVVGVAQVQPVHDPHRFLFGARPRARGRSRRGGQQRRTEGECAETRQGKDPTPREPAPGVLRETPPQGLPNSPCTHEAAPP